VEKRREKIARRVAYVFSCLFIVVTVGLTVGLLYLVYLLYTEAGNLAGGGMGGGLAFVGLISLITVFVVYGIIAVILYPLLLILRGYYTEEGSEPDKEERSVERTESAETVQASVSLNESQETATVRVRRPADANPLKVYVGGEVRGVIEKPRQDDSVTVDKKPDENIEVRSRDAGYRLPTRD